MEGKIMIVVNWKVKVGRAARADLAMEGTFFPTRHRDYSECRVSLSSALHHIQSNIHCFHSLHRLGSVPTSRRRTHFLEYDHPPSLAGRGGHGLKRSSSHHGASRLILVQTDR
jgi:hypothetical protein